MEDICKQIPFRYECALELGTSTIYPDFTIHHPQTCETHEHPLSAEAIDAIIKDYFITA